MVFSSVCLEKQEASRFCGVHSTGLYDILVQSNDIEVTPPLSSPVAVYYYTIMISLISLLVLLTVKLMCSRSRALTRRDAPVLEGDAIRLSSLLGFSSSVGNHVLCWPPREEFTQLPHFLIPFCLSLLLECGEVGVILAYHCLKSAIGNTLLLFKIYITFIFLYIPFLLYNKTSCFL